MDLFDFDSAYNNLLNNYESEDELALRLGTIDKYTQKLINTTRSIEEKYNLIQNNKLSKELDVTGYSKSNARFTDADSGFLVDESGNEIPFRLSDSNPNKYLDALDLMDEQNKSDFSKELQADLVANLTGKRIEDLTPEDYINIKNYQQSEVLSQFLDNGHVFSPYDNNKIYNSPEQVNVPLAYKVNGRDSNGRLLIEAINPTSGRQVSFDMSNNPYLNTRNSPGGFDIYASMSSIKNDSVYVNKHKDLIRQLEALPDGDSRLGEDIDIIQSSAYQSAARLLQYGPDFLVNKEKWEQIANPETGQMLADAWAGVSTYTRRDYANKMLEASDAWDNGDYTDAILGWGSQMDRLFAESATQMGLIAAGTMATGGALGAIGATSTVAKLGGAFLGASLAGVDKTLTTMEEFKLNNGRDMTAGEIAETFAINTATLIPESFLLGVNFASFLPKQVASRLVGVYEAGAVGSRVRAVATSTAGEFFQEGLEEATDSWLQRDRINGSNDFIKDYLFTNDTLKAGIIGGMMGGTLSGIGAVTTLPISSVLQRNRNVDLNRQAEDNKNYTNTGTQADLVSSNAITNAVNNIDLGKIDSNEKVVDTINALNSFSAALNINRDTINLIEKKKFEIIKNAIEKAKDTTNRDALLKLLGKSKEEVLKEQIFFSDMNAESQLLRDGKRLNKESLAKVKEENIEFGKKLGLSSNQIDLAIEQVENDVRNGWRGYNTYSNQINQITNILNTQTLDEKEKANLLKERERKVDSVVYLLNNQVSKLLQFAEHSERIARGETTDSRIVYKSGGSFKLIGSYLAKHTYDSGYGPYGMVRSIEQDINEMINILKSLPKEFKDRVPNEQQIKNISNAVQRFKDASSKIKNNLKEKYTEKTTVKVDDKVQSKFNTRTLKAKLKRLAKGMQDKGVETRFINEILNASKEQIEEIRKDIENNEKSEVKEKLLNKLNEIIDLDSTTKKEVEDMSIRHKEEVRKAEKLLNEIDDTAISKLNNAEQIQELITETQSVLSSVVGIESAKETIEAISKQYYKLKDKLKELLTKEVNKEKPFTYESRDNLKNVPARTNKNGIVLANDITANDLKITKQLIDLLNQINIDYNTLISKLRTKEEIENFIYLHELRHQEQINKRDSYESFMKEYSKNPSRFEFDATIYALYKTNLITKEQFREAYVFATKLINESNNTTSNSLGTKESPIQIYSDGSDIKGTGQIGYGAVFIHNGKEYAISGTELNESVKELQKLFPNVKFSNPTMEMLALATVLEEIASLGIAEHIQINQDYKGAVNYNELWNYSEGSLQREPKPWKAKEKYIQHLVQKATDAIKQIEANGGSVKLNWVKGHQKAGTEQARMNDLADKYAKSRDNFSTILEAYNTNALNEDLKHVEETEQQAEEKVLKELDEVIEEKEEIIDIKDYVSNSLLNTETNYSATYAPSDWNNGNGFNINNEIKLSNNPGSTIATKGAKQSYIDRVKSKITPILLTLSDKTGSKIGYFNKIWEDSPHLRLIFNFITKEQDENLSYKDIIFEPNDNVLAAIDLSVKEFFSSMNVKDTFNPAYMTKKEAASLYGYNESLLTDEQYEQIKAVVKEYGIPEAILAQRLGDLILNNLGLRENINKSTRGYFDRTAMGMGLFALSYSEELGYTTKRIFDSKQWTENYRKQTGEYKQHAVKYNTPHIKFNNSFMEEILNEYLGTRKDKNSERIGGLKSEYKLTDTIEKKPRTNPSKLPNDMKTKGTNHIMNVPAYVKNVFNKLWNKPSVVNLELAEIIANNKKALMERVGYVANTSEFTFDERNSFEGSNLSIESEINHLLEAAAYQQKHGVKWRFNWFFSKNGRLNLESNHINPQTMKSLQRFSILPESMYRDFDPSNTVHMESMYFAIAQAFDSVLTDGQIELLGKAIASFNLEKLEEFQYDLINKDTRAFVKKYSELYEFEGKKYGIEGVENYGHALNVIQHLREMKKANGKPFKTWLAVENDSTTSGYFIRFLQFPDPKILKEFAEKVGIILDDSILENTEIHNLKKVQGFLDIYKTMAKNTADILPKNVDESIFEDTKYSKKDLVNTFKLMYDALPKPEEDGSIGSALRKLLKSSAMTFGYGAGKKSISDNLSSEIMKEFISTYAAIKREGTLEEYLLSLDDIKESEKIKITSIYNTMEHINKNYYKGNGDLLSALNNNLVVNTWLKVGNKNINIKRFFNELLAPTYGEAVWNSLSKSFSSHLEYNESMNHMFNHMFELFDIELTKKEKELKEKYPAGIPTVEYNKAVEELFDLMPAVRLAYSSYMDEGMLLMNTEKTRDETSHVSSPINKNGKTVQTETYANVREFINSGKAGAVLPIHFLDGMAMTMLIDKYPSIIPVHDAAVMSALDNRDITREYNLLSYQLNTSFNMYNELVERYLEILMNFDKRNGNTGEVYNQPLKNQKGEPVEDVNGPISISMFINKILKLNDINIENRENMLSRIRYISNMDGIKGSGVYINPNEKLDDRLVKEALADWSNYSDPNIYKTDNDVKHLLQEANTTVEGRVQLFDTLQQLSKDLGNKLEDKEFIDHLKKLVGKVNPKHIQDLVVEYSTSQDYNVGMLKGNNITIGFDNKTDIDRVTGLSPFSGKSAAEIYAHEIVHAGIRFAIKNKSSLKLDRTVDQLMKLQKTAMDVITWHDFMPDNYSSELESVYENNAKKLWNYIFNNPNTDVLEGLQEFVAHGLTNQKMMNKLNEHYVVEQNKKLSLLDRILKLVNDILDIVYGATKITDLLKNETSLRSKRTLYKELEILTNKINFANKEATNSILHHPKKALEHMFKLVGYVRTKGNQILSPTMKYLFNIVDHIGLERGWKAEIDGSWFDKTKLIASLALIPFSKSRRESLGMWGKNALQLSQQGTILTILREIQQPDLQTSRLGIVSSLTRTVEQVSKALESTAYQEMIEAFNRKDGKAFTVEETNALTKVGLFTDISCLLEIDEQGFTNIDYIRKLVSDKEFLKNEINSISSKLENTGHGIWYKNQALHLANFMLTGVGNEALNLNATNIARGRMTGKLIEASNDTIQAIDKLTTLYAIQMSNENDKAIFNSFNTKGLENFLTIHKNFVKETKEGSEILNSDGSTTFVKTIDDIHTIKGYTKQIFDTSFDITVDLNKNEELLNKEGFVKIKDLGVNEITGVSDLALYKRTFASSNRRDGAGFIMVGANSMGTTLKQSAIQTLNNIDPNAISEEINKLKEVYYNRAEKVSQRLLNLMQTEDMPISKVSKISKGYTPIVSPKGGIADFRITMNNETKINDLGMDTNGLTILSKMYATQNTRINAATRNKILVEFLREDMKNNMNPVSHKDSQEHEYILLSKDTNNKFLKDAWSVIPKELMEEIKKEDFYVREDWLGDLFGVPNMTLAKTKLLEGNHRSKLLTKRAIAIAEYIMKAIAYQAKQNIIIRVPAVLIGNILSNLNYSVSTGSDPFTVAKKTIENTRNIREYVDDRKDLNRIQFRQRIGTASETEVKKINWYKAKLENNPVHVLMEKGMYQAIVEDINPEEMEIIGKVNKIVRNNKWTNKIPNSVKTFTKHLFLAEGTPFFEFMFKATQYSDFVSRATEYQLQMEKAPEKYKIITEDGVKKKIYNEEYLKYEENLTIDIWSAFINYDKTQSSFEQYLNDLGLVMFTKYAKRIQHQITKGIVNNPMGVLMFLFFQSTILNTDDIYEQNVFNKSWSSLIHSPFDNAINALTPVPLQFLFGMRSFDLGIVK